MLETAELTTSHRLREVAAQAALKAGEYLATAFRRPMDIQHKTNPHDQVTVHDRAAEHLIREVIAQQCPGSIVVGEEDGVAPAGQAPQDLDNSHIVWHVDPIDGTSNFAQGLAFFCTSIAVEIEGQIRAAAVYDPMAELLCTADDDAAYLNGNPLQTPQALPLPLATLITGYPTAADLTADGAAAIEGFQRCVEAFSSVRRTGSGALSIVHVAAGWTDVSLGTGVSTWDVAAAMLILRRAGGTYRPLRYATDLSDQPDHYAPGYLATGPGGHYPVVDTIAAQLQDRR